MEEAIELYLGNNISDSEIEKDLSLLERPGNQTDDVHMQHFSYLDKNICLFNNNEKIRFAIDWTSKKDLEDIAFKIIVRHRSDSAVGVSLSKNIKNVKKNGSYRSILQFDPRILAEGQYVISISIFQRDQGGNDLLLDHITRAFMFDIEHTDEEALVWQHKYWGSIQFDEMLLSNEEII